MPNDLTQQEWLEHKLSFMGITVGTEAMQAAALIAAWPSSPQGLAVKALVEAAEIARKYLADQLENGASFVNLNYPKGPSSSTLSVVKTLDMSLDAARKAGLVP